MSRRPACMAALLLALAGPVRAQRPDSSTAAPPSARSCSPRRTRCGPAPAVRGGPTGSSGWTTASRPPSIPSRHELRGRETIHYVNRSPDPLPYLWLFLEQNICAPGSVTNQLDQPPLVFLGSTFDFSCKGFAGGSRWSTCGSGLARVPDRRCTAPRCGWICRGRSRRARCSTSTSAGGSPCPTTARAAWAAMGPSTSWASGTRAWWCTTTCAGWNHEPYIGGGEFYLEYGRFDVALTVPATYVVGATGVLLNPQRC